MTNKSRPSKALSRKERRDLDIEIRFIEGVLKKDPQFLEALQVLGDDYTRCGRFEEGLNVDQQLAQLCSGDSSVHYNLACSYARTGQLDKAFDSLERAIDLGYRNLHWLSKDPDLTKLRKHPRYRQIRAKVRSLKIPVA